MSYQHQPINLPRQLQGRQIETSLLGKGSFGKIYLIKDANKLSVLKEISINHLSEQDKKKAMSEATILSQLNHPNICSFIDSFVGEPYGEHLYIIMEYADGGDLRKLIKNNKMMSIVSTEEEVKNICRQCSLGLKHIHDVGIIHRDIKSENIFLHNKGSLVKLGDFGISKVLDRSNGFADTMVGTPYYFSPELCENKPYGKKSDIWALGCVFYELLKLDLPFKGKNLPLLVNDIISNKPESLPVFYSQQMRILIQSMLDKLSERRPTIDMILDHKSLKVLIHNQNYNDSDNYSLAIKEQISQRSHGRVKNRIPLTKIDIKVENEYMKKEKQNSKHTVHKTNRWRACLEEAKRNVIQFRAASPCNNRNSQCERILPMKLEHESEFISGKIVKPFNLHSEHLSLKDYELITGQDHKMEQQDQSLLDHKKYNSLNHESSWNITSDDAIPKIQEYNNKNIGLDSSITKVCFTKNTSPVLSKVSSNTKCTTHNSTKSEHRFVCTHKANDSKSEGLNTLIKRLDKMKNDFKKVKINKNKAKNKVDPNSSITHVKALARRGIIIK